MIIIIAAMSEDRIIGAADGMPWNVPEEYAQYLAFVRDNTVIMGRPTWRIFGAEITSAHNIVLSRSSEPEPGAELAASMPEALERATSFERDVFIAGGGRVYSQALDVADAMYLSTIKGDFSGDTWFPEWDPAQWTVAVRTEHERFVFTRYLRAG